MVISKSHPRHKLLPNWSGGYLGDSDGVVGALLVPQVANQLPVVGAGAHVGAADDVLDSGLQVLVRAPAGGVCFFQIANVSQPSYTNSKGSDDAANEPGWRLCAHIGSGLKQLTCLGSAAGGLKGGRELALSARGELGKRIVVLGDGSDDGDGHGEEGLELHFGGWGVLSLIGLVVVVLFGRLFE